LQRLQRLLLLLLGKRHVLLQHGLRRLLSRGLQLQLWGCCPGRSDRSLLRLQARRSNLLWQLLRLRRHGRRLLLLLTLLDWWSLLGDCLHGLLLLLLLCSRRGLSCRVVMGSSSPLCGPAAAAGSGRLLLLATALLLLPRGQHRGRSRVLLLLGRLQQGSPPTLDLAGALRCCLALLLLLLL
jgi:hypothetical protein